MEPVRSILIPKFDEVKKQSLVLGALGGGISGFWTFDFYVERNQRNC